MTNGFPTTNGAPHGSHPAAVPLPSARLPWGSAPATPLDDPRAALVARIDAVVRAVLQELTSTAPPSPTHASHLPASEHFAGPLLALRHVESLPSGVREVRIDPSTVLTPLARDQLRRLGIAVRIVSRSELARAGVAGEWGLAIESALPLAEGLRRSLLSDRDPWADLGDDPHEAAAWVAVGPHRAAVIVAAEPALVAWSCSQTPGVRAAALTDPDALLRAARSLAPNCLVIDPAGQSIFAIRHLCATFRRIGVAEPSGCRAGLGPPNHSGNLGGRRP